MGDNTKEQRSLTPAWGSQLEGVYDLTLRGRALRFVLVEYLMRRGEVTVAEMAAMVRGQGHRLPGRASKVISDALRWEVRRGRVVRLGRGRYAYRSAPTSTARRIRHFGRRCRAWLAATAAGQRPVPTPPDPPSRIGVRSRLDPGRPPWVSLRWLWVR